MNTNDNEVQDCMFQLDVTPLSQGTPEDEARAQEANRKYEERIAEEARIAAEKAGAP